MTALQNCAIIESPQKGFYFFAPKFGRPTPEGGFKSSRFCGSCRRCRYESQNHPGLHGMQAAQLQHHEEQEERPGQTGNEQILPVLPQAHSAQGNQITHAGG